MNWLVWVALFYGVCCVLLYWELRRTPGYRTPIRDVDRVYEVFQTGPTVVKCCEQQGYDPSFQDQNATSPHPASHDLTNQRCLTAFSLMDQIDGKKNAPKTKCTIGEVVESRERSIMGKNLHRHVDLPTRLSPDEESDVGGVVR